MPWLGLEVFLPVPDAQTFAAAARDWFAALPGLLAPEEWEEVLRNEKPPFTGKPQMLWPEYDEWQEPFMAWAEIVVAPLKWNGRVWQRRVTRSSLGWLAEVLADRPANAHIRIGRMDAAGIDLPGAVMVAAAAALGRPDELIPVGRLSARESLMWRAGARLEDADELRERQVRAARSWAARPGLLGLFAGEEIPEGWGTALTASLEPRLRWERAALERELQGYSWITLCPAGAAARVGGAAALRDSRAFWRVEEQPDGAVLLQATERVGDYDLAAAAKVFDVLAPVLPDGLPQRPTEWPQDVPWLLVPEDASWRRGSERAAQLVSFLTDARAREDERDDAAMELEFLSGTLVESALMDTIRAESFSSVLAQTCAESLAGIWAREGRVNQGFFDELEGPAKDEVTGILSARAPDLLPSRGGPPG